MAKKIPEKQLTEFKELLEKKGEEGFYHHAVATGVKLSTKIKNPEVEMMQLSEACLLLNRQTGENLYAIFAKVFKRAAHKLYRQFNKEEDKTVSKKFLRVV